MIQGAKSPLVKPESAFEVEVDVARNIARTRFSGNITAAQLEAGAGRLEEALFKMRVGFVVLADLTGLESMGLDCAPPLARIMDLCKARGVRRVIRVIPDPAKDIGLNILSLIHYRGEVQIVTCATMAEGERALA